MIKFSWARLGLLTVVYSVIWSLIGLKIYNGIMAPEPCSTAWTFVGPEFFWIVMALGFLGWIFLGAILLVEVVQMTRRPSS